MEWSYCSVDSKNSVYVVETEKDIPSGASNKIEISCRERSERRKLAIKVHIYIIPKYDPPNNFDFQSMTPPPI